MKETNPQPEINRKVKQPFAMRVQRKNPFASRICFASARNLFIDTGGNVYPCCFNRSQAWGNLGINTPAEIENSIIRQELEARLSNNLMSDDCSFCRHSIAAGNYKAAGSMAYDRFFYQRGSFPYSIEFELDTFCNLNCVMCPENLHSSKPQFAANKGWTEKLTPWLQNIRWAKFYGGEPFLISIYYEIWEVISEKNPDCIIKVQTNGTLLNDRIKKVFERGRFQISVSVDSLNAMTYAAMRKGANLEHVLANLAYFRQYAQQTGIPADVAVCPMVQNAEDIPELYRYCCKKGMYINFNVVTHPKEMSLRYQSATFLKNLIDIYKSTRTESLSFIARQNRRHLMSLIRQLESWHNEALILEKIPLLNISRKELLALLSEKISPEKRTEISRTIQEALQKTEENMQVREDIYKTILALDEQTILNVISENPGPLLQNFIRNFLKYGPG